MKLLGFSVQMADGQVYKFDLAAELQREQEIACRKGDMTPIESQRVATFRTAYNGLAAIVPSDDR